MKTFVKSLTLLAAASAFTFAVLPQNPLQAEESTAETQTVEVPTFAVDPVHSSVVFGIKHNNLNLVFGRFNKVGGTIKFHPEHLGDSSLEITADIASIDTNNKARDGHLQADEYFAAENNPIASFKSTTIEHVSGSTYKAQGDLTFSGKTNPITFEFEYGGEIQDKRGNTKTGANAELTIDRTQWGQTGGLDGGLAKEAILMVTLQAVKQ